MENLVTDTKFLSDYQKLKKLEHKINLDYYNQKQKWENKISKLREDSEKWNSVCDQMGLNPDYDFGDLLA